MYKSVVLSLVVFCTFFPYFNSSSQNQKSNCADLEKEILLRVVAVKAYQRMDSNIPPKTPREVGDNLKIFKDVLLSVPYQKFSFLEKSISLLRNSVNSSKLKECTNLGSDVNLDLETLYLKPTPEIIKEQKYSKLGFKQTQATLIPSNGTFSVKNLTKLSSNSEENESFDDSYKVDISWIGDNGKSIVESVVNIKLGKDLVFTREVSKESSVIVIVSIGK